MNHILSATTISKPFGTGQRVLALALEYDTAISGAQLSADAFTVENRHITGVYTASAADAQSGEPSGRFVILALDKRDEDAPTVKNLHPHKPQGGPGGPGGPGAHGGPRPHVMADGRVRTGPFGLSKKREPLAVKAEQVGSIAAADGTCIEAGSTVISAKEINELSDKFVLRSLDGNEYNLYIPENYDPNLKYPLVLFTGDASIAGKEARITLEQGVGALCWVSDEEQAKHPCFVLAPAHNDPEPITDDEYWCTDRLETNKAMCEEVIKEFSIDPARVYTTGQSMGCMSSFEYMYRYPDFFAAALCVSGHWDRRKIADIAGRGQKLWFVFAEGDSGAFPCAVETKQILDEEGTPYGWYEVDGRLSTEELSVIFAEAAKDSNSFRITMYPGDTALRIGMEDECRGAHPAGWNLSYRIEALRDWLFTNSL